MKIWNEPSMEELNVNATAYSPDGGKFVDGTYKSNDGKYIDNTYGPSGENTGYPGAKVDKVKPLVPYN